MTQKQGSFYHYYKLKRVFISQAVNLAHLMAFILPTILSKETLILMDIDL